MLKLPLPAYSADLVYQTCLEGIRDPDRLDRFQKAAESVAKADSPYRRAGEAGTCADLPRAEFELLDATVDDMIWLYENKLVGKSTGSSNSAPGRAVYDAIQVAGPQGRCALCGICRANTVDHFLPKTLYAALTVNPANLIPACGECNHKKSDKVRDILHPYYDNIEQDRWLSARVLETTPPVVQFEVQSPQSWSPRLADRVSRHFATFGLARAYSSKAAELLSGIKGFLGQLDCQGGTIAVRDYLKRMETSLREDRLNSWQAACHGALAASDWFCAGGFRF